MEETDIIEQKIAELQKRKEQLAVIADEQRQLTKKYPTLVEDVEAIEAKIAKAKEAMNTIKIKELQPVQAKLNTEKNKIAKLTTDLDTLLAEAKTKFPTAVASLFKPTKKTTTATGATAEKQTSLIALITERQTWERADLNNELVIRGIYANTSSADRAVRRMVENGEITVTII